MEHIVRIHSGNAIEEKTVEKGKNLLRFLRDNKCKVSSPCNGNGTCGKCRVMVEGDLEKPSKKERNLLGEKALQKGYRLACCNHISGDLDIYPESKREEANILTESRERKVEVEPIIRKKHVCMKSPTIDDQRSDLYRIIDETGKIKAVNITALLRELPEALRKDSYSITLGMMDKKLIFLEAGDTTASFYGIAVDIGTTTIAAYLYNLVTGEKLDVYSTLNPQRKYGADVLSRIDHTISNANGLTDVKTLITDCMNEIIDAFTARNSIKRDDIYEAVFVGNTTMIHFLMGISARYIATSPFIPVTTELHKIYARELDININNNGYAVIFPGVSAYIGADTVAAVLSSGMYASSKISLLIDIGTNGEMVLGSSRWMYACSTAAGPAFEGANIRNGVGGVSGAIDKIIFEKEFSYTTIGNQKPIGICGSGIVDAVAGMLGAGIIDETGRIVDRDEAEQMPEYLKSRLVEADGKNAFMLAAVEENGADTDISITQKDVRELQNAKAAIAAGVKVLAKSAGIALKDIDRVYLAGGFGSYISIDSALKIGLLPVELKGKIESIGNAAGRGAVEGLLSCRLLKKADSIRKKINYIELSTNPDFVDEYVECMMFE